MKLFFLTKRNKATPSFNQILPDFMCHYRNEVSAGTVTDFGWAWKRLEPTFGDVGLEEIDPGLIETYKSKRLADGVKKCTINRELSYIATIIKWADENRLIEPLPFRIKKFKKRDTKSPVPTVHTPEEISKIIAEVKPAKRGLVLLMYDAGLRRTEACTLRGDQIDIDLRQLRVWGKGGKERILPILTARLLEELKVAKQRSGNGYLFINPKTNQPYKSILTSLRSASRRAGIDKHVYHHLLRHDHGTHTAIAGVDVRAVQRMLGHASLSTTEIYTHLAGGYLRDEGQKFAELIERTQAVTSSNTNHSFSI